MAANPAGASPAAGRCALPRVPHADLRAAGGGPAAAGAAGTRARDGGRLGFRRGRAGRGRSPATVAAAGRRGTGLFSRGLPRVHPLPHEVGTLAAGTPDFEERHGSTADGCGRKPADALQLSPLHRGDRALPPIGSTWTSGHPTATATCGSLRGRTITACPKDRRSRRSVTRGASPARCRLRSITRPKRTRSSRSRRRAPTGGPSRSRWTCGASRSSTSRHSAAARRSWRRRSTYPTSTTTGNAGSAMRFSQIVRFNWPYYAAAGAAVAAALAVAPRLPFDLAALHRLRRCADGRDVADRVAGRRRGSSTTARD